MYESDEFPHGGNVRSFPKVLEDKLVEAKKWCDERSAMEAAIRNSSGPGSAQRNQDDWDESDRAGALMLDDIVELIDEAWGWGLDLGKDAP